MSNNIVRIDNVPEGFELTGEYRIPKSGDWFINFAGEADFTSIDLVYRHPILRKLEPPNPPAGWEVVERRAVRSGDYWINKTNNSTVTGPAIGDADDMIRWIVRKVWQPPAWMPKGCWLYQNNGSYWYLSNNQPEPVGGNWFCSHSCLDASILAALHGETFIPPTHTNCVRV